VKLIKILELGVSIIRISSLYSLEKAALLTEDKKTLHFGNKMNVSSLLNS